MTQLTLPITQPLTAKERESLYWKQVFSNKTDMNIQEKGRLALTHFIEADKNIKSDPNYYKNKLI